ncbi:MAG: hypothetical protein CL609_15495 [Anaerolineaceae bacterium]|nr:hypothetical protein [Anaerolineaceae bacterium]
MKKNYMWIVMIACCLIPIVLLGMVFLFKVPLNSLTLFGIILICPLSHFLMMKFMPHDEHHTHATSETSQPQKSAVNHETEKN